MLGRFQRIGLLATITAIVLYIGFRELRGIRPSPIASVTPTVSVSAIPSRTMETPPTVTPTATGAVIARMNQYRAENSVATLEVNSILTREAQEHASDMLSRAYFDHTSPEGVTFQERMAASGYPAPTVAENLGLTSGNDAIVVVGLWMESQGHRENLLNPAYGAVGIGIARGMWQGRQATFVVAIFGSAR